MTLRKKFLFPIIVISLPALFLVYLGVTREMRLLSFEVRRENMEVAIGNKMVYLPEYASLENASPSMLPDYFGSFRKINPAIFRMRVYDEKLEKIIGDSDLEMPFSATEELIVKKCFEKDAVNSWKEVGDDLLFHSTEISGAYMRGFIPLRNARGTVRYVIILDVSMDADTSRTNHAASVVILLVLGVLLLLIALKYLIIELVLLRPLLVLQSSLERIARGDLGAEIATHSNDEIGQISRTFQAMTKKLRDLYIGFDKKVEAKTKALAEQVEEAHQARIAIENLLEDSRLSSEKEKEQSNELALVTKQVEKHASDTDKERNMYSLMLANIDEGVIVANLERNITVVNATAERLLGYTRGAMLGRPFIEFLSLLYEDRQQLDDGFWDNIYSTQNNIPRLDNIILLAQGAREIHVHLTVTQIIHSRSQQQSGIIITLRDVSEERALEEARIGFISTASHQLRTPLTSMRWFSEMLLSGDAGEISPEQRHFIDRVYQGTDRMISLVNLLLQLARVEAGRIKVEPISTNLAQMSEAVATMLKTDIDAKHLRVDILTDPSPFPQIAMDQDIIWQVLQNLLSNAVRYSREDQNITVRFTLRDDEIECMIKDTGIGIPEGARSRLFEKFFRAENAVKAIPEGSGLGLTLVKTLVERWGGRIWFESNENEGTMFFFTIPMQGMKAEDGEVKLAV